MNAPMQTPASQPPPQAQSRQLQQPHNQQQQQKEERQQDLAAAAPAIVNGVGTATGAAANAPRQNVLPPRDAFNYQSLGRMLNAHVKQARVLMVGAGGIGCELLKNLALTGFAEIHVVDLDTIDLSNLNRQFLFRHDHIKKSKALVAKEVAQRFNPNIEIVAHHADIKDSQFNTSWYKKFRLVFNALDNLEARRHVNRMCLAANVPLIESGTTGFNGQVQVIKKGITACYDCSPKDVPKSFPVCTIRSTPSQPIHCIVWAKSYLLNEMFGASEDESAFDHSDDQDNANEIEELKKEAEALRTIRQSVGTDGFPRMLFDKVFNSDIMRLRSMEDMWKSRKPPVPLEYENLMQNATAALASKDAVVRDGQKTWSLEENLVVFNDSLDRLSKRITELKKTASGTGPEPIIDFDKDDEDTLNFVTASANIRSHLFDIEKKSRFEVKQMAGNIIPAIATTNAIVAGLCVLQAFKVLRGEYDSAKEVFLTPFAPARLLSSDKPREPNPDCPVCSVYQTSVFVDLSKATLGNLVEDFVKLELGFGEKEFSVNNEKGLLYDIEETENLGKKLSDLGIKADSFLTIIDDDEDEPLVNIVVSIQESAESSSEKPVRGQESDATPNIPKRPRKIPAPAANGTTNGVGETNGKHALDIGTASAPKRSRADDVAGPDAKKAKIASDLAIDDLVLVDDKPSGGAIVIDD